MNCLDLEGVVSDVARGQVMDAALRETALSHAESCARCATRLADERALTSGLQWIAAADPAEEAPVRVEAALLAAFREQHSTRLARPLVSRWLYVAAGIAAVAAMVVLLSLIGSRDSRQPVPQNANDAGTEDRAVPTPPPSPQLPASPANAERKLVSDRAPKRVRIKNPGRSKRGADDLGEASSAAEIATDFFPLVNRESLTQLDGGQVVRVELPRSALMSFGLPMNMERANERVKADVVVGNDGLARAIRFVR